MSPTFKKNLKALQSVITGFDNVSNSKKKETLNQLRKSNLPPIADLSNYMDLLLFICAHPPDKIIPKLAERELTRVASFMRQKKNIHNEEFNNTGLPYSCIVDSFSHDLVSSLMNLSKIKVEINSFDDPALLLNDVLKITLPSVEKEQTSAGMSNEELMDTFLVKKEKRLSFILSELSKLDDLPLAKDQLYDSLHLEIKIIPQSVLFSRAYNRLTRKNIFYHDTILKKFDHELLLKQALPEPVKPDAEELKNIVSTIRHSLTLTNRETDPVTYMDEKSLRLYELERGISIAIYGIISSRQLPLESYVGYTLFKNGYPAAYGGGWVFGKRSLFGISIFESFRGGESGFMMCQLLRVYRQVFNVSYFEVEAYQYGEDNPEGIDSGAFWFYYRYGFRPLDKKLLALSNNEAKKIVQRNGYRTSKKILIEFTKSNIALNLSMGIPPTVGFFTHKITRMINKKYGGDRKAAVSDCILNFLKVIRKSIDSFDDEEKKVLEEYSLLFAVFPPKMKKDPKRILELISYKSKDLYKYQQLLLEFLNS